MGFYICNFSTTNWLCFENLRYNIGLAKSSFSPSHTCENIILTKRARTINIEQSWKIGRQKMFAFNLHIHSKIVLSVWVRVYALYGKSLLVCVICEWKIHYIKHKHFIVSLRTQFSMKKPCLLWHGNGIEEIYRWYSQSLRISDVNFVYIVAKYIQKVLYFCRNFVLQRNQQINYV